MKSGGRARVPASVRRGPSRTVVAAIVVPVLALLAGLIVFAFTVRDWTWFSLLIAAAIGVSAFVVAPDMFSISDKESPSREWQVHARTTKATGQAASAANRAHSSKAPHKSA